MKHLDEQELMMLFYGEPSDAQAAVHLATCQQCEAALEALKADLAPLTQLEVPEGPDDYGEQVWASIQGEITRPGLQPIVQHRPGIKRAITWLAAAAALVLAFLAGRESFRPDGVVTPANDATSERLVFNMLEQHLEETSLVFTDLRHGDDGEPVSRQQVRNLVDNNRLYRAALPDGQTDTALLLDALEMTLLELAHHTGEAQAHPEGLTDDIRDLLFKIRALQVKLSRENPLPSAINEALL